uniref:Carboxylic ester hydrolase n=1 Tax=Cnaphalocrocis medinalis TaxID=437488 RepID=A0A0C5BXH0_CNAME|nr:carboxylesterase [Cnaphalocrocis medinalis]
MRSAVVLWCLVVCVGLSESHDREERLVRISQGPVRGYKEAADDFFGFYGIPYATAPTGKHRFKAPLPAPEWLSTFEAVQKNIVCPQVIVPYLIGEDAMVQEDCLVANILVPDTNETNLPVAVYVHGGGFQIGHGRMFMSKKILNHKKFIIVNFNYRLGAHGFLCLGTEAVPGNAGMKDQVALLRWVKKNIANFGGNPSEVTIWGSSAGSSAVDLLMLSPSTKGLFNKVIPESGANLAAFSVQTDPIANAIEYALLQNLTDVENIHTLEEFYTSAPIGALFKNSFIDRKDSTFVFSPCVERKTKEEAFLEDSPYNILKSGKYEKVPILYGFANMEGLMRIALFDMWKENMNEKFSDFLLPDLQFRNNDEKEKVSEKVKEFYFGDKKITEENVIDYIDYFSDVIFTYGTLRAVGLHVNAGHDKVYLYEYSYVNEMDNVNSPLVPHTNNVRGANHCSQSAAVFDGLGLVRVDEDTLPKEYQDVKQYLRQMWTNFITTGSPVPSGSSLPKWPAARAQGSPYMSLGATPQLRTDALLNKRVRFWDGVYERHYRAPQPPPAPSTRHTEL